MKRFAEKYLSDWFKSARRKPLLIRGARQVGKSTLVRNFCRDHDLDLHELNFERLSIKELEKEKNYSIDKIIQEIEIISERRVAENSLIFFDEIQACPPAIAKLRYFYEERPEIKLVAAGSLLEFVLDDHDFSMPVGRIQYLFLGPMTFSEFLQARDKGFLLDILNGLRNDYPAPTAHERLSELFKEYIFIGGMPEAIKTFILSGSFLDVAAVHREIIHTYLDDFPKYRERLKTQFLEDALVYAAANPGKKIIYSKIVAGRSQEVKEVVDSLLKARLITKVTVSNCSGVPLKTGEKANFFKLYFLDVGLAGYLQGIRFTDINPLPFDKLLGKGFLAEQFVAQHLSGFNGLLEDAQLFYWASDKKNAQSEVDFVLQHNLSIIPVEVKSGKSGTLKSLQIFNEKKNPPLSIRLDLNYREHFRDQETSSARIENLLNLPVYAVETLREVIEFQLFRA